MTLGVVTLAVLALLISTTTFILGQGAFWDRVDQRFVDAFVAIRRAWLTDLALALNALTDDWVLRVVRWVSVIALVALKRWRHLFAFAGLILVLQPAMFSLSNRLARPRADGVEILAAWAEFSSPSLPVVALTITLVGMTYAFVVPGRGRKLALLASSFVITLVALARMYLGVDRMTDGLIASVLAAAATLVVFRFWAPDAVFPVTYSRGKVAHLDLTDLRREAIFTGLHDQLGVDAIDVEQFGLEASGGSTPLLVTLRDGTHVFAKLYARNHLRSDRWYKLGRSLMYGALEDERPFRSVRAIAQHEDYIMRLMTSAGVPGPDSYGIVEITPGREYLLVSEFLEEASEISSAADVGPGAIDSALKAVRAMWDGGLAHRDIKPGNVLVRDGEVFLIDAAFGETRPSPWREAVDLANMMLTLSLRSTPADVYAAARRYFTDDDIAEAFAATRGVTIPSELARSLRDDGRDLVGEFRDLAPKREPIRIQRWTPRRVGLLLAASLLGGVTVWLAVANFSLVGRMM